MKNSIQNFVVSFLICALAISLVFIASPGQCEPVQKVAVCPLQMNAAQDLSFLQKGLFSMLSSRLADPGKVQILDRETIDKALAKAQLSSATKGALNESKARLIGKEMGVDYVLFGNITMFGSSVSLDTTMVDVSADQPTLTFSRQATQPGAVITEMDLIATQINLKTFNRRREVFIPQAQYAQAPLRQQRENRGSYASPLTNYRSLFATNGEIIGMASGDVDGDKKNEVVIVYPQSIEILKDNLNGQLISIKKIKDKLHMDIVGVDVADINQNGIAEIFITRVHRETGFVKSYVLEKEGDAYKNISGILPWYLRVVKSDIKKYDLYAQKSGKMGPYKGDNVFRVEWENNSFVPGEKLRVPVGFSVMSMSGKTDIGNVVSARVFTDKEGRLVIFNEAGAVEWSGEEGYGGSKLFYEFKETDKYLRDHTEGSGAYFQPRNIVFDFGSDGKKEVFIIKNVDVSGGLFAQVRRYKTGGLEIMNWSEMGLSPDRAPKKIPGQITDIAIAKVDNSLKPALLVAFIKKRDNLSSKDSKSMIIAYDME